MDALPRGKPVLNPTLPQLWTWAAGNQEFVAKLMSLPECRREEALNLVYRASLKSYFEKVQRQEAAELEAQQAQQPLGSDPSIVRGRSRSKSELPSPTASSSRSRSPDRPHEKKRQIRNVRTPSPAPGGSPSLTKRIDDSNFPQFLVCMLDNITLASFFQLEKIITSDLAATNGSGSWQPLAASEEPRLLILLASINMIFKEKRGQQFQVLDANQFINFNRLDRESFKAHDLFVDAQSRLGKAVNCALDETTPETIAKLADALHLGHLGRHILFRQEIFADLLDSPSLKELYQQYRCKILTHYARLAKELKDGK